MIYFYGANAYMWERYYVPSGSGSSAPSVGAFLGWFAFAPAAAAAAVSIAAAAVETGKEGNALTLLAS